MPGSSLWLLPPADHPLDNMIPTLIDQTSSYFDSPHRFLPHITLTSEIQASVYSQDAQAWLNSVHLPTESEVHIQFEKLGSEDVFFRKLYIKCEKNDGLKQLGKICRSFVEGFEDEKAAAKWAEENYNPHLSLLYHDCPKVEADGLSTIEKFARDVGIGFNRDRISSGWSGGRVVLVPTDRPIDQWKPIAWKAL